MPGTRTRRHERGHHRRRPHRRRQQHREQHRREQHHRGHHRRGRPVNDTTPDLLIVGAGPAGLAAATTAARHGARVVVVDEQA
ncbi:FAD-binding protein, partial [Streptomyces sp. SID3343]|nr:FAD-binding protein [Streptomyces sp. SID3343]